jgi:hypothetical protein
MSDMPLKDAVELVRIGAGKRGYRSYPGTGGIWAGDNDGIADAVFVEWGLARATATILNAALDGQLIPRSPAFGADPVVRPKATQ